MNDFVQFSSNFRFSPASLRKIEIFDQNKRLSIGQRIYNRLYLCKAKFNFLSLL